MLPGTLAYLLTDMLGRLPGAAPAFRHIPRIPQQDILTAGIKEAYLGCLCRNTVLILRAIQNDDGNTQI
jgi:hypothetical protein